MAAGAGQDKHGMMSQTTSCTSVTTSDRGCKAAHFGQDKGEGKKGVYGVDEGFDEDAGAELAQEFWGVGLCAAQGFWEVGAGHTRATIPGDAPPGLADLDKFETWAKHLDSASGADAWEEQLRKNTGGLTPSRRTQRPKKAKPAGAHMMSDVSDHGRDMFELHEIVQQFVAAVSEATRACGLPEGAYVPLHTHQPELNWSAALQEVGVDSLQSP